MPTGWTALTEWDAREAEWLMPMNDAVPNRDALIARRYVNLADTLVDDYDIGDLLDQLVHTIIDLLPVEHAGLLLLNDRQEPQLVASTSESTRLLELFQLQGSEGGPCLECIDQGTAVVVDDLSRQGQRWPQFSQAGSSLGFESVYALPMRIRREVIGTLNLFGGRTRLSENDLAVGQSLADMATIAILQQHSTRRASVEVEQLQRALNSRVVIEQAKGILAEFGDLDMEPAFNALRGYSRDRNLKIWRGGAGPRAALDQAGRDPAPMTTPDPDPVSS